MPSVKKVALVLVIGMPLAVPALGAGQKPAAHSTRGAAAGGYVGSERCKGCHADKYAEWKGTLHSRMVQELTPGSTDANFATAPFRRSDAVYVIGGLDEYDFVGKDLNLIPYFWDMGKREWVKQDVYHWHDDCAQCHTTGWNPETKRWKELGISCEACHGPGGEHVASGGAKRPLRSVGSDEMCGRCHNGTEKEPRQGVRVAVNHGRALETLRGAADARAECLACHSQDYREAPAQAKPNLAAAKFGLTCVTCHDPHRRTGNPGQLKAESNALCKGCHTARKIVVGIDPRVAQPQKEMLEGDLGIGLETGLVDSLGEPIPGVAVTPIKKKVTCADCHMKYDVPRSAGTMPNHSFRAGTPSGSYRNHFGETIAYNSCASCHTSMTQERFDADRAEIKARAAALERKIEEGKPYWTQAKPADQRVYATACTILSFVKADGSWGVHNQAYTKALLDAGDSCASRFLKIVAP